MKPLIDRSARESLAESLRQLASGAITNVQFENSHRGATSDPAIREIANLLAWPCYDDTTEHRLESAHALTDGQRQDFARAVLFLKSELPYRWPARSGPAYTVRLLLRALSFGTHRPEEPSGNRRYWPFWSANEYQQALHRPVYLCGSAQRG